MDVSTAIEPTDYPLLFTPIQAEWGPMTTVFEMGVPPAELISNVTICGYVEDEWVIIRQDPGWGPTGGTLEPGESYNEAVIRELKEEAGAELVSQFEPFGGLKMVSSADAPYRPHLPHPISYRVVGIGEVRLTGSPTNPPKGEQIREVGSFPLDQACSLLSQRTPDSEQIVQLYRLAAEVRSRRV